MRKVSRMLLVAGICIGCIFTTSCGSPWAVALMNQIVTGTTGAINLAAAINGTPADASLIGKVQTVGNGFIAAYTDWEKAAPNLKPGAWAKVQEAMTLVQQDVPPILTGLGVKDQTYLAVANFVISEVLAIANTINGTTASAAASRKVEKPTTLLPPKEFKAEYNKKMAAAGHPEFGIK